MSTRQTLASAPATNRHTAILRAIRHLMRPIVRLMIRHSIALQTFQLLLKSVYTEEAEKEIIGNGGLATDSQITLMTGLHRAEVKRLREDGYESFSLSLTLAIGADVVTQWLTDRRFLTPRREPKMLSTRRGELANSFATLVRAVDPELRPGSVLAEMRRLGVVSVEGDRVMLIVDAFVPQKSFDEKLYYLAENAHDHLAAAMHNIDNAKLPMLEQSISASELSSASAQELELTARTLWKLVMQQILERSIELEKRDKAAGKTDTRIKFGTFFYNESLSTPVPGKKREAAKPVAPTPKRNSKGKSSSK